MNSFILASSFMAAPLQKAHKLESGGEDHGNKVKASSIPLYPEPEKWDYVVEPPSRVESLVKDARIQASQIKAEVQPVLDKACNIISTGRAHTNETLITLRREDNLVGRLGAMAAGGLLGLIAGRRGGFIKKLTYFSMGLGGAGSLCYPSEAKVLAKDGGKYAMKNACIAYHFVIGTRPDVQNENGKAFEKMATMASDVTQWGFRLFERKEEVSSAQPQEEDEKVIKEEEVKPSEAKEEEAVVPPQQPDEKKEEEEQVEASVPPVESTKEETPEAFPELEPPLPPPSSLSSEADDVAQKETKAQIETEVTNEETKKPLIIEGDLGQGNPEDKELYTTRE